VKVHFFSRSYVFFILFIITLLLVGFSYYAEYVDNLTPCLLCWFQRWSLILFCIFSLIAFVVSRSWWLSSFFSLLMALVSLFGIYFASRQVWLQHQPASQGYSCLPNAEYILKTFPVRQIAQLAYSGTSDCGIIDWKLWGVTMPEWSLVIFILLLLCSLWQFRKNKRLK